MKKYQNIETWANAMRKDKKKKLWQDWFNIGGHLYTCEEYDGSGKYMRYTSITERQHIDIETKNRYSDLWLSDMEVTQYPIEDYLRFDISYYMGDIKDWSKKDIIVLGDWLYSKNMYKEMRGLIDLLACEYVAISHGIYK